MRIRVLQNQDNTSGGISIMHVGVIGVGVMGRNHARVYSEMKAVDLLSVFDVNTASAQEVARSNGANCCETLEELLSAVDAVSICVPTRYHFKVAKEVVDHDIPLLIEKPICQTVEEARKLVNLIPSDLTCGVGHIERFNPVVNEIARILQKPLYIEIKRHNPASARISDATVVEDLMIHDIDIIFNLMINRNWSMTCAGNQDLCSALFMFDEVPVSISASRKSSKKIRTIYIEEEECTIEGDLMAQEVYIHRKPNTYTMENSRYVQENIIEKVMVNKTEPLKMELSTFIRSVRERHPFPITPQEALRNLEICDMIKTRISGKELPVIQKIPVAS
jgi:predicted dehydrogenase